MACYWGCETKSNKLIWYICSFFFMSGGAIFLAGAIGGTTGDNCLSVYRNCYDLFGEADYCANRADDICQYKKWSSLIGAGVFIFMIGGFGPMAYFCCCSKDPHEDEEAVSMVGGTHINMTSLPSGAYAYPPTAQPYPYPPQPLYGQPYPIMPVPPYSGGPLPPPVMGTPVMGHPVQVFPPLVIAASSSQPPQLPQPPQQPQHVEAGPSRKA
mmetsp:Transcript_40186/g.89163  ORF Transcript_40186/g.89163 Transcript_40186/m.89163 type:complete len:212 (+) Transcript_40186:134-769(+)|eukprot:CAMPEP_0202905846 /NCGR_PEP_ID=MMETSP1392-20130828/36280_1 /ASSEMBLY_ACC=CAM_ASM_000868 /TAXON_ID=225041 /ORGANISM="Chlamydomonas chlamydogama, Strain SAG 11-48b" /LENGTH=211 /DNA_ID=CAMNT_0049594131 /DNA_START=71 /DNA_END=706 /DNA_ORIENTATION=-